MNKIVKVGLVQIGDDFNGEYYLPYSIGVLHAYAKNKLKEIDRYLFLQPIYKRFSLEKTKLFLGNADIVFFSSYLWNFNFSIEIAKRVKRDNPKTIIVFGGPQIPVCPNNMEIFLRKYSFIDIVCYGEGECAFVEILENFYSKCWTDVSSIGYINSDNLFKKNRVICKIEDLDQIPSPYLEGVFDSLMQDDPRKKWAVMWETNRGCPFSCSYCAWGNGLRRKIYKFGINRIYNEIDWFSNNKIEFVFCCDANFGIFKERDMQIVNKIIENKEKFGYPKSFSVQSTKNATETIFEIQEKLNSAGLQKGVNLALQSVNKQTLKSINRSNIPAEQFQKLQKMFTAAGVITFSDMILGLPDETYDTFVDGVSSIIAGGQHNRIQFINLALLENTEMASQEYIKKFGLAYKEVKMVSHHTSVDSNSEFPETQKLVIATNTMSREDWVRTRTFCWMVSLLYFNKLLQIPLLILSKLYSLKISQIIEWFLNDIKDAQIISRINRFLQEKALSIQSGDIEYIPSKEWLNIYWPIDEFIFITLCTESNLEKFHEEVKKIISDNLNKCRITISENFLNDVVTSNMGLIKQPFINENKEMKLHHNILDFYKAALVSQDIPLLSGGFSYEIIRNNDQWCSWLVWCKEVVWFGTKKGNYLYPYIRKNN